MASVWLDRSECTRDGGLPPVCIVCGAEAQETTRQTFRWHPPWVIVLILVGVLIWVIVALILTKTMVVYAPVCELHRGHWYKRKLAIWLLVLGGFAIFIGSLVVLAAFEDNPQLQNITNWAPLPGVLILIIALIVAVIVNNSAIRPTEITDDDIRLKGVDEEFVAVLKDQRRAEREERERRRRKRYVED